MKNIIGKQPPNWKTLEKEFGVKWGSICVTYGDKVYSSHPLSPDLVVHEFTHVQQQGKNPKKWWARYIKDQDFRLEQETEAYKNQIRFLKRNVKDRNLFFNMRRKLAGDLSGSMYGNCISFARAMEILK